MVRDTLIRVCFSGEPRRRFSRLPGASMSLSNIRAAMWSGSVIRATGEPGAGSIEGAVLVDEAVAV